MLCESCGAPLPPGSLNCDHCGRRAEPPGGALRPRPVVPQSSRLTITDDGLSYEISWRWFRPVILFLIFFCIAWDSFLVFWYTMAVGMGPPFPFNIIMVVFPVAHVAVGVGLTWYTLCGLFNRTVIDVTNHQLSVRHVPLFWPGNFTMDAGEIRQIYVREKICNGENGATSIYRIEAILKDGTSRQLLGNLEESELALAIEQALEKHLRIDDEAVAGELPR